MTVVNRYWQQVARARPEASPWSGETSYVLDERRDEDGAVIGTSSCTAEGLDHLITRGRIMERWAAHIEALAPHIGLCADHRLVPHADFTWGVNDYVCEPDRDPEHVDIILWGWHDPDSLDRFCIPVWLHTVPGGLIWFDA